jgi:3-deoxy-D-manno-octulosonate 8-phosphate phosphatase (KDO 8-P phosphatase)
MNDILTKLGKIKALFFDVDGVLTDGSVTVFNDGSQIRKFNIKDGWAINRCVKMGYKVIVISAGRDASVIKRLEYLGVKEINIGVTDKEKMFEKYVETNNFSFNECLYMGDDMADYKVMKKVEVLAICPADAADDILAVSDYVTRKKGGEGAVREVLEKMLKVHGNWPEL